MLKIMSPAEGLLQKDYLLLVTKCQACRGHISGFMGVFVFWTFELIFVYMLIHVYNNIPDSTADRADVGPISIRR